MIINECPQGLGTHIGCGFNFYRNDSFIGLNDKVYFHL